MICQVKKCKNKAVWHRISIATEIYICNSCRKKQDKEFQDLNGISPIKWWYYKKI